MSGIEWIEWIRRIADENEFVFKGTDNRSVWTVYIDHFHAVAYQLRLNGQGFVQVHQWESEREGDDGQYGRAVYSIRNFSDCLAFCSILISSAQIRAKRRDE